MTKEELGKVVDKAFAWAWEDFCFKPMEFYATETGRERFREYIERGVRGALRAANVEVDE